MPLAYPPASSLPSVQLAEQSEWDTESDSGDDDEVAIVEHRFTMEVIRKRTEQAEKNGDIIDVEARPSMRQRLCAPVIVDLTNT